MHVTPFEFNVEVPGATLHGVTIGSGASDLVLLHGGPGASHDYLRPQLDALAGDGERRVIYYDQRGSGRSTLAPSTPYGSVADHVADLESVRAHLGLERLVLGGYSWGGLLALHYAIAHPSRVRKLLLISTAPGRATWRHAMKERLAAAGARPSVAALKATLDMTDRRNRFAIAVAGYFVDVRRALELTPFLVRDKAERAVWDSLGDYDILPALAPLSLDTFLLHGVEDPIPLDGAREIATALRAPLVELSPCGHVPYIEAADKFFAEALAFLRRA